MIFGERGCRSAVESFLHWCKNSSGVFPKSPASAKKEFSDSLVEAPSLSQRMRLAGISVIRVEPLCACLISRGPKEK